MSCCAFSGASSTQAAAPSFLPLAPAAPGTFQPCLQPASLLQCFTQLLQALPRRRQQASLLLLCWQSAVGSDPDSHVLQASCRRPWLGESTGGWWTGRGAPLGSLACGPAEPSPLLQIMTVSAPSEHRQSQLAHSKAALLVMRLLSCTQQQPGWSCACSWYSCGCLSAQLPTPAAVGACLLCTATCSN